MSEDSRHLYEFGRFRLDTSERLLLHDGQPVPLTPKAFEMLVVLVGKSGRLVEKDELIKKLWPDSFVEESNLTHNVWTLRKALGESQNGQRYIETVPKCGYRFTADVRELNGASEELVVEKHSFTRIVTESEEQIANAIDVTPAVSRSPFKHQLRARNVGLIILGAFALVIAAAAFVWVRALRDARSAAKPEMTIERLTNGGEIRAATLSPDGKYFAYVEQDGAISHLWLRQTEQSNPIEIIPPREHYIGSTAFSPDGLYVYFTVIDHQSGRGELYRVPALGGPQTKLQTGVDSPITFSPDGKRIAFIQFEGDQHKTRLVSAAQDGSDEKVLLSKEGNEWLGGGPSWSPDGKLIASGLWTGPTSANDQFCTIIGLDSQSAATRPITSQKWEGCGRIAWAGDGKGFVLIGTKQGEGATGRRDQVWYVSYLTGETHLITTDLSRHHMDSLGLTSDSNALLVVPFSRISQVWSMEAKGDSHTAAQITSGTGDGRAGIAPLPDGRVAFIRRTGDHVDLWEMKTDGTEQKQLTTDPPFVEELRATPDGRYLIFASNRDGLSHLFRVDAGGGNLKQLTSGDSKETDSDCSPDGKWLVYASATIFNGVYTPQTLWKISIDGGTPVRLTDREAYSPHFSNDGGYISYAYLENQEWKLAIMSADGGLPLKAFETVKNPELNVGCRFTPDGKALTYLVDQKGTTNIWLQPIDGSRAHPLTDFQSGQIYNYSFSRDGSRLFLARGYDVHDVTLIRNFNR
jgi:Tol biopolymer transport system component/DNA-binding winged helix-turn-helix (wHTH) protein